LPLIKPNVFEILPGSECVNPFPDGIPRRTSGAVVYVLDMMETPFVKIGSTSNARSRFVSFQTGSPFEIRFAFYAMPRSGLSHVEAEQNVHRALDEHRVRGEWFQLPVNDAISAIREALK
jgi:hypothetical protein